MREGLSRPWRSRSAVTQPCYNMWLILPAPLAGRSFNGRTRGSGPWNRGSNPCLPAKSRHGSIWLGGRDSGAPRLAPLRARILCCLPQAKTPSSLRLAGRQGFRHSAARAAPGANPLLFTSANTSAFASFGWEAGIQALRGSRRFGRESFAVYLRPKLRLRFVWLGGRDSGTPPLARLRARILCCLPQAKTPPSLRLAGRQGFRHSAARAAPGANPLLFTSGQNSAFASFGWEAGIQALRRSRGSGRESFAVYLRPKLRLRFVWLGGRDSGAPPLARLRARILSCGSHDSVGANASPTLVSYS